MMKTLPKRRPVRQRLEQRRGDRRDAAHDQVEQARLLDPRRRRPVALVEVEDRQVKAREDVGQEGDAEPDGRVQRLDEPREAQHRVEHAGADHGRAAERRRPGLVAQEGLEEALRRGRQRHRHQQRRPVEDRRSRTAWRGMTATHQSAMLKANVANRTCDAAARLAQQHRAADSEADDGGDQRGDRLDAQSVTILPDPYGVPTSRDDLAEARLLTAGFCCASRPAMLLRVTNAAVLVLNRHYQPIHVTNVRRAFSLLYLGVARVIDPEFKTFDFDSWAQLCVEIHERRRHPHRQPRHPGAARHRASALRSHPEDQGALLAPQHLHARRQHLPVLRPRAAAHRAEPRPRRAARPGRAHHLGERRLLLHRLQPVEGRAHAGAGGHEAAQAAAAPALDADLPHQRRPGPLPRVAAVPRRRRRLVLERRAGRLRSATRCRATQ